MYAKKYHARGVLIVPRWQSAPFWPMLRNGDQWINGIECLLEYSRPVKFFNKARTGNDVFSEYMFKSNVLILRVQF
jgi:hypothetical protein